MSIAEKFASMEYGPAPEDPKEAATWLDRHNRRFGLFIDGGVARTCRGTILRHRSIPRPVRSWLA